ncbi:MAG: cytochrome bc1 complex cytochrome b subunit [Acidimicrobiales bacterium]
MSTTEERRDTEKRLEKGKAALDEIDDRLGSSRFLTSVLDKIFPDHWSFMVGEIAMYCFVILLITGTYLALFFVPSSKDVVYSPTPGHGFLPLAGQHMSEAYRSVINISFDVRAGLVMRQAHHWAALIFLAAIAFHLCRIFFTGAFRKPRETNWIVGLSLLLVSMLEGFSGYSLPDDLLSGTGLRVVFSIVESLPLVGTWAAYDIWGGPFPGTTFITRLFVIHEFIFPLLIVGLLSVHLMILWHQKHTDFPGPGKTEHNIRGSRVWPQYAVKSGGLFMLCAGVIFGLGGLVQINPIWSYGPYSPFKVSAGAQPDWYVGWLDGAVRLWPHWEFRSFGHEIANPFFPGLLIPGIVFSLMFAWPAIDKRIYKDYASHNLLDRPRDKPVRTAVGVAALLFFTDLTFASATDLLGNDFHISFERLIEILQYGSFVGPAVGAMVAYRVCKALQRTNAHPIQRPIGGIIVRDSTGAYHTLGDHHHAHGADHDDHATNGHHADAAVANGHRNGANGDGAPAEAVESVGGTEGPATTD